MKCLQGASALEQILKRNPNNLEVFVVWERVLRSDWTTPVTSALARLEDRRVEQFWDPGRAVSKSLGETSAATKVWDWAAVYPAGTLWDGGLPQPIYAGRPVEDVSAQVESALSRLAAR